MKVAGSVVLWIVEMHESAEPIHRVAKRPAGIYKPGLLDIDIYTIKIMSYILESSFNPATDLSNHMNNNSQRESLMMGFFLVHIIDSLNHLLIVSSNGSHGPFTNLVSSSGKVSRGYTRKRTRTEGTTLSMDELASSETISYSLVFCSAGYFTSRQGARGNAEP